MVQVQSNTGSAHTEQISDHITS